MQVSPFHVCAHWHVTGDVEEIEASEKTTLKVFKNITLLHEAGMVTLEVSWASRDY